MTKLELTLIGMAKQRLSEVKRFLENRETLTATDDGADDYLCDSGALSLLLELGYLSDSGMGTDAVNAMLEIEAQHSAAVRASQRLANPVDAVSENHASRPIAGTRDIQNLSTGAITVRAATKDVN